MAEVIELTDVIFHRPACGNETASRAEGNTVILCRSKNRGNGNEEMIPYNRIPNNSLKFKDAFAP